MIKITETQRLEYAKDRKSSRGVITSKHLEKYKITTVWFLFIPLFIRKELVTSGL